MVKILEDSKVEKKSFNNQKERTSSEERAAWRRRIMRWHKKATIALGLEGARELLMEAHGFSEKDTAEAK